MLFLLRTQSENYLKKFKFYLKNFSDFFRLFSDWRFSFANVPTGGRIKDEKNKCKINNINLLCYPILCNGFKFVVLALHNTQYPN